MASEIRLIIPTESEMRIAMAARDRSYDDVFVYGVVTTGVFCLPSCTSRLARPENLSFFFDIGQAQKAGLRACKRCRPLGAAARKNRLIELARKIRLSTSQRLALTDLAEEMKMSTSAFRKLFKNTFGVSPKAYRDAARLETFKTSLHDGEGVAEPIFEAGFGSTSRVYGEPLRNIGMKPSAYRAGGEDETIHYACRETTLGALMMAATDRGVCFAQFGNSESELLRQLQAEFSNAEILASTANDSAKLDGWIRALDEHLSESGPRPDVPLDLRGTAFQIKVWRALLSVPEGDVISYGELAANVDKPKAFRATASACAANRIAVLVPCHRVLRGDGNLSGYRWGVDRKRAILDSERERKSNLR